MGLELIFDLLIGTIGFAYLIYGKKDTNFNFIIFGIILMSYSFFIQNIFFSIILGIIFTISPFVTDKYL